jgi:hypothetical protein
MISLDEVSENARKCNIELSKGLIADTGNDPEQQPPANKPPPPFNIYISSNSLLFCTKYQK